MTILYENDKYYVSMSEANAEFNYYVINKGTERTELETNVLPQAIMACEEFTSFLEAVTNKTEADSMADIIPFEDILKH